MALSILIPPNQNGTKAIKSAMPPLNAQAPMKFIRSPTKLKLFFSAASHMRSVPINRINHFLQRYEIVRFAQAPALIII